MPMHSGAVRFSWDLPGDRFHGLGKPAILPVGAAVHGGQAIVVARARMLTPLVPERGGSRGFMASFALILVASLSIDDRGKVRDVGNRTGAVASRK